MATVICDTGPLVALLDQAEQAHDWVLGQLAGMHEPMLTCEAVLAELVFLTVGRGLAPKRLFQLLERDLIRVSFDFEREWRTVGRTMETYSNLPMSLADACLVRMSELHPKSVVFTLDRDFLIYRKSRRLRIPLLAPFA